MKKTIFTKGGNTIIITRNQKKFNQINNELSEMYKDNFVDKLPGAKKAIEGAEKFFDLVLLQGYNYKELIEVINNDVIDDFIPSLIKYFSEKYDVY